MLNNIINPIVILFSCIAILVLLSKNYLLIISGTCTVLLLSSGVESFLLTRGYRISNSRIFFIDRHHPKQVTLKLFVPLSPPLTTFVKRTEQRQQQQSIMIAQSSSAADTTTTTESVVDSNQDDRYNFQTDAATACTIIPYEQPIWTKGILVNPPTNGRLLLANLPTPIHRISVPNKYIQQQQNNNHDTTSATKTPSTDNNNSIILLTKFWSILQKYNIQLYIKHDDMTSTIEMGGNKIRKLEFLLADALKKKCNCIVTIGGQQSNHCRATACASRLLNLQPHLILRTSTSTTSTSRTAADNNNIKDSSKVNNNNNNNNDIGFIGNLLYNRMVGSTIYTCTIGEYGRFGSNELLNRVCSFLTNTKNTNNKPYPIPVGGSNGLGTWGYINAIHELFIQSQKQQPQTETQTKTTPSSSDTIINCTTMFHFNHIVFACGSGGTAAGIGLGIRLLYDYYFPTSNNNNNDNNSHHQQTIIRPQIHAMGVCDDEEYFYNHMQQIAIEMGYTSTTNSTSSNNNNTNNNDNTTSTLRQVLQETIKIHQAKGNGYSISTYDELQFINQLAIDTGIVLDPVYTGKAFYNFVNYIVQRYDSDTDTAEVNNKNQSLVSSSFQEEFLNKSILFWHTGGSLGLYDKVSDLISMQQEKIDLAATTNNDNSSNNNIIPSSSVCYRLDMYGQGIDQMGINSIDLSK